MTVRELIKHLEAVEDKDMIVVVPGRRRLFARAGRPEPALMTPGYNWRGSEERPALLIEPEADEWGLDRDR